VAIEPTLPLRKFEPATEPALPPDLAQLSDMEELEIMGSVPIWILSGLRLERTGWRSLDSGWTVGIYRMDASAESGFGEVLSEN